jgi:hypothetical protein
VRGRGRRAAAIGECGFNGFRYDVKNEGGRRGVGQALFDEGNRGGTDGASLPLLWSTGGRPMAERAVVVPARPTAAQAAEVGDKLGSSRVGRKC